MKQEKIRVIYFTDPICSSCWTVEPQLRKLLVEYGDNIALEYHMGGLLPSWDMFTSGPISKPADVGRLWTSWGITPRCRLTARYGVPIRCLLPTLRAGLIKLPSSREWKTPLDFCEGLGKW